MSDEGVMLEFMGLYQVFVWVPREGEPTGWRVGGKCTVEQAQHNARYAGWEIHCAHQYVISKADRAFVYAAQRVLRGEPA